MFLHAKINVLYVNQKTLDMTIGKTRKTNAFGTKDN